jgi:hypothetical protein
MYSLDRQNKMKRARIKGWIKMLRPKVSWAIYCEEIGLGQGRRMSRDSKG